MKEHLTTLVREAPTASHGRNVAREHLPARILSALQRTGAFIPLAFHGGTALRVARDFSRRARKHNCERT